MYVPVKKYTKKIKIKVNTLFTSRITNNRINSYNIYTYIYIYIYIYIYNYRYIDIDYFYISNKIYIYILYNNIISYFTIIYILLKLPENHNLYMFK